MNTDEQMPDSQEHQEMSQPQMPQQQNQSEQPHCPSTPTLKGKLTDDREHKKNQSNWGNKKTHRVFCESPDPHNDGETDVWEVHCMDCNHEFSACSECVMDGDCQCPICDGLVDSGILVLGQNRR